MMIKDLEMSKELDREALVEVRGGSAYAGGQTAVQGVFGGGILSPTVGSNTAINAPVAFDNDSYSYLGLKLSSATVNGSAFTEIWQ